MDFRVNLWRENGLVGLCALFFETRMGCTIIFLKLRTKIAFLPFRLFLRETVIFGQQGAELVLQFRDLLILPAKDVENFLRVVQGEFAAFLLA